MPLKRLNPSIRFARRGQFVNSDTVIGLPQSVTPLRVT